VGDLVLDRKMSHSGRSVRPEMKAVGLDQLRGDPDSVAGPAHTPSSRCSTFKSPAYSAAECPFPKQER